MQIYDLSCTGAKRRTITCLPTLRQRLGPRIGIKEVFEPKRDLSLMPMELSSRQLVEELSDRIRPYLIMRVDAAVLCPGAPAELSAVAFEVRPRAVQGFLRVSVAAKQPR